MVRRSPRIDVTSSTLAETLLGIETESLRSTRTDLSGSTLAETLLGIETSAYALDAESQKRSTLAETLLGIETYWILIRIFRIFVPLWLKPF